MIDVSCPYCAKTYALPENVMGKSVKCAGCREQFAAEADGPPPGMFATRCICCGKAYAAPDRLRDRPTTCPACRQVFVAALATAAPAGAGNMALQPYSPLGNHSALRRHAPKRAARNKGRRSPAVANKVHPALQVVIGVAMLAGGGVMSALSFQNAQAGESYTVFTGLIVVGLVTSLSGAYRWMGGRMG